MKILILTDYFYPHISGGVEKVVLELSQNLIKLGHEVCVLTLNTTKSKKEENFCGVHIVRVNAYDLTKIIGLQSAISINLWSESKKLINEFHPDVIHLHNRLFFTTLIGIFLRKHFHLPTLVTIHIGNIDYITGIKGYFIRKLEKFMIRLINNNSSFVTAVSKNVRENVITLGIKPDKCTIVPNGVNLPFFNVHRSYVKNPRKIVFVGRLIDNKGPQILVESANILIKKIPDVKFFIVGEGPLRKKLEKYSQKNYLTKNITFLGGLEDIREIMKECDLYVRPSFADGMPLGVLEALASQLPVVASRIDGITEIIQHGKTGHLVTSGNGKELAEAIYELLMNPSYMEKISKNGFELVQSKYDWTHIATEYEKYYKKIVVPSPEL